MGAVWILRPRGRQNTVVRAARSLGLATWLGGAVMGRTGLRQLDGAAAAEGQRRWGPLAGAGIAAYLAGSAGLGWAGRQRGPTQQAMPTAMVGDTVTTIGALAVTAWRGAARTDGTALLLLLVGPLLAQGRMPELQRPLPSAVRLRGTPDGGPSGHPLVRAAHDAGLATVFGGALLGVAALDRSEHTEAAWQAWTPVAVGGLAVHGLARAVLLGRDAPRLSLQRPAGAVAATGTAAAAVAAACLLAQRLRPRGRRVLRWGVVWATGAALVLEAKAAEQQRTLTIAGGILGRLP